MINIDDVRNNPKQVIEALSKRGINKEIIEKLAVVDAMWRDYSKKVDGLRAEQNKANAAISEAPDDAKQQIISQVKEVAIKLREASRKLNELKEERHTIWRSLPNMPLSDVPMGGEEDFEVVRVVPKEVPAKDFVPKSYLDLTEATFIDLERGAKVSGSRFAYLKGDIARLQMALVSYTFDLLQKDNFIPIIPPVLIGENAMAGMGYLDKHADEVYKVQDELYLTGTSEQAVGPMHMNEILQASELPLRYVAYSSCFRREAGSHGKDVKGIMRMHQFEKIEMFSFTKPNQSENEHEFLLSQQEKIMAALELPYKVIKLATGDIGMSSAKTYDIETWIPSENRYRETHSTSNTTDYQARRLNIRVRDGEKLEKAHMLNGTAIAIGRTLIALIENHQQADGSISMPTVLHPYLPFTTISPKD